MVKFTNDFGEWTCLGESSLKFLNEHFHDDFFQDTSTGKNPLNICIEMDDTSKLYPFFMETDDSYYIRLHANKNGLFDGIAISGDMQPHVIEVAPTIPVGHKVEPFMGASDAVGTVVLRFDDKEKMEYAITHQAKWLEVRVRE